MAEVADFNLTWDLTGVGTVDLLMADPPGGVYEGIIVGVLQFTAEGDKKDTTRFQVSILEDPCPGLMTTVVVGNDFAAGKGFNGKHAMNLMQGLHSADGKFIPPDKLQTKLNITPGTFVGKRCYLLVKPPAEGEVDGQGRPAFANKNFITKPMYENGKRIAPGGLVARPAAQPTAPAQPHAGASVIAPPPASPAAPPAAAGGNSGVVPPQPLTGSSLEGLFS